MQELQFACDEQDFIYNYGINKGHSLSYSKINRCYFLSCSAKQLYSNILGYAFSGKGKAFPCQATLRAELGLGKVTFIKYLQELKDKGFITCKEQGANKPLIYLVNRLASNTTILHSEIVHSIRIEMGEHQKETFINALEAYKEHELYEKVKNNPLNYYSQIEEFFRGKVFVEAEPVKEQPKPNHIPKAFRLDKDMEVEKPDKKKPTKKQVQEDITLWKSNEFISYFEKQYLNKLNLPYLTSLVKDRAIMKRVIEYRNNNEQLKAIIDVFIEQDYFQVKTISAFGSQFSQTAIDMYLTKGTFPYEKNKTNPSIDKSEEIDIELNF